VANIRKRGGRWQASVRKKGHEEYRSFSTKKDAHDWARDLERALDLGHGRAPASTTMTELIDRYVEAILPEKAPSTARDYLRHLRWWNEHIGHLRVNDVTPAVIASYRDRLKRKLNRGKQLSPATVRRYLASLSTVYTHAIKDWHLAAQNPVRLISKPSEPRGREVFLSRGEATNLIDAVRATGSEDCLLATLIALGTGARLGEINDLEWSDITQKGDRAVLRFRNTKNGDTRYVAVAGEAKEILLKIGRVRSISDHRVIRSKWRGAWERARSEAGLHNVRFHDLRHTWGSWAAMSGKSPGEIAAVLGHRTLAMVKRYSHIAEGHISDTALDVADTILG
jgi:integrase